MEVQFIKSFDGDTPYDEYFVNYNQTEVDEIYKHLFGNIPHMDVMVGVVADSILASYIKVKTISKFHTDHPMLPDAVFKFTIRAPNMDSIKFLASMNDISKSIIF